MESSNTFKRDIYRSLLLGRYIAAWGQPHHRRVAAKGDDQIEVYSFPSAHVTRLATIGVSCHVDSRGHAVAHEILLVLPSDLGGATSAAAEKFVLDLAVYSLGSEVDFTIGRTIPETHLAPPTWSARAFLLDEPRGEPEELEEIQVGPSSVSLVWVVPIYGVERDYILAHGLEAFDDLETASDSSLADPRRPRLDVG